MSERSLGLDLPGEAVVGLEGHHLAGIYLEDRLHLWAEGEDGLLLGDGVIHPLDGLSHTDSPS